MKFCLACRGMNRDQARFCGHCGKPFSGVTPKQTGRMDSSGDRFLLFIYRLIQFLLVFFGLAVFLASEDYAEVFAILLFTSGIWLPLLCILLLLWYTRYHDIAPFPGSVMSMTLLAYLLGKRRGRRQAEQEHGYDPLQYAPKPPIHPAMWDDFTDGGGER